MSRDMFHGELSEISGQLKTTVTKEPELSRPHVGTSALTRDLVWCECGRGLSLSGKWIFCPSCGRPIDQESYSSAVDQAKLNGEALA